MDGQSSRKLKRTLADRLSGQEQVEKKFEKNNLNKKAKLEKKKNKRLSKSEDASTEEMQTESGGLLEAAGYERIDKKSENSFGANASTNTNNTAQSIPVNTQELVALINNAQIEKLRGVIKICLKYAMPFLSLFEFNS